MIDKSYKEPISLNSVAEQLNITPQYLSRLFMKEMSRSFVDYLTSYRMERAKNLLQDTNLSLIHILPAAVSTAFLRPSIRSLSFIVLTS